MTANLIKTRDAKKTDSQNQLGSDICSQLEMAAKVQQDFLPKSLPQVEGFDFSTVFLPADCVSGDIYDIQRLDEEHIGFFIADAVGHSMPAALLTVFIKQAIEMRETTGNEYVIFQPDEVLHKLNRKMVDQHLSNCLFATAVYCLLNIRTCELRFARAGHPYPVLIKSDGETKVLESRGSLLGVFDGAQFLAQSINLEKGDKLFLYSDGLEQIIGTNDDSEDFSFNEDFYAATSGNAVEISETITDMVSSFEFTETEDIDDITAITLEISK